MALVEFEQLLESPINQVDLKVPKRRLETLPQLLQMPKKQSFEVKYWLLKTAVILLQKTEGILTDLMIFNKQRQLSFQLNFFLRKDILARFEKLVFDVVSISCRAGLCRFLIFEFNSKIPLVVFVNRCVLFFIFLSSSLFALKRESIGKIVAIEGIVKAVIEEEMRILEEESPIFVQDLIEVGSESRAQIEFSDGTITNLIPETQFRIDSYKYKKILQKDTLIVELIKGGLRTLSGSISKRNLDGYKIRTPSATIGLRGTVVEAAITSEGVYVGVQKGQAYIENRVKSILLGMGEPLQFAFVKDINSGFELIGQRPQALNPPVFSAPPGGVPICEEVPE